MRAVVLVSRGLKCEIFGLCMVVDGIIDFNIIPKLEKSKHGIKKRRLS